ncbi:MAG: ribosome recycling factor [Candidatus Riflebacteria bacterium]|nr:ribosome recycling factor [Candidatus Riflebacteria bacterium]
MLSKIYKELRDKMDKTVATLKDEMATIRTGRANPAILDRVRVDYYGTPTEIRQLASISVPDPRTLMIAPWDKGALKDIEKAILKSDLGLHPSNDGKVVRLAIPELTEERRLELVKQVKKRGEEKKIVVRNFRREANELVKKEQKDGRITEDESKQGLDRVQKLTDEYVAKIDEVVQHKEEDVMQV